MVAAENRKQVVRCASCGTRNRVPEAARGRPRCPSCKAQLPWVARADDADFAQVVDQAPVPVLLDLWAEWCGPCRVVSPILERLAVEFAGRVKLVKVDVDAAPVTAQRFDARSIPTLLVLDHGQPLARRVGAAPQAELRTWLERALPAG